MSLLLLSVLSAFAADVGVFALQLDGTLVAVADSDLINVVRTPYTLMVTVGTGSTARRLAVTSAEAWDPIGVILPVASASYGTDRLFIGPPVGALDLSSKSSALSPTSGPRPRGGSLASRTVSLSVWDDSSTEGPDAVEPVFGGSEASVEIGSWDRELRIVITDTSAGFFDTGVAPTVSTYIFTDDPDA